LYNEGKLADFIGSELKSLNVDIKSLDLSEYDEKAEDVQNYLSNMLDSFIFDKCYKAEAGTFEASITAALTDYGAVSHIEEKLKFPKLLAAALCIAMSTLAISKLKNNPVLFIFYGLIVVDSSRVSYNCYIKKYCSLASKRFLNDSNAMGETLMSWTQKALGIFGVGNPKEKDPLEKLKREVMWDVLLDETFSKIAMKKILDFYGKHQKKVK